MATWTTIPDTSLEPGKPIRSIDALALRDNPIALAEGQTGAPRIEFAALNAWYLTAGGIGTYVFARSTTASDVTFGSTIAGSALFPTGAASRATVSSSISTAGLYTLSAGSALTGTWRCMGLYDYVATSSDGSNTWSTFSATLWVRIA